MANCVTSLASVSSLVSVDDRSNYLTGRGWNEIIHLSPLAQGLSPRRYSINAVVINFMFTRMDFEVKGAEIVFKFVMLYFRAIVNEALGSKCFYHMFSHN